MMVTFISQCQKKALKKTRRVLDSFANRIGNNTWQTIITKEGLDAVQKLLRKTASKSTAVSCHWIRNRSRSDFLWAVGNKNKFNKEGIVPVHTTQKNILDNYKENSWKYLPLIRSLVAIASLFHDWGKASDLFQKKLQKVNVHDVIRHEWVSCLLLHSFIKQSEESQNKWHWLEILSSEGINEELIICKKNKTLINYKNYKNIFSQENTYTCELCTLIFWLIVSHHKLPLYSKEKTCLKNEWDNEKAENLNDIFDYIKVCWGYEVSWGNKTQNEKSIKENLIFSKGLLTESPKWVKEVKKWASKLLANKNLFDEALKDDSIRIILHHCRLAMMLGDHNYSSKEADKKFKTQTSLFANTKPKSKESISADNKNKTEFNQPLDEHLLGVTKTALYLTHLIVKIEDEMPFSKNINILSSPKSFQWQDKTVKEIKNNYKNKNGFFAVNMASTGCGKTIANAKIMKLFSPKQKSLRYTLALGLRTLTLQTGDEYRKKIGLKDDDMAVLIGSKAVSMLHNSQTNDDENDEKFGGSQSIQSLNDDNIDYNNDEIMESNLLTTVLKREKDKKLLHAPVLVCTIDHLMAAVETKRGGKYILPSLRLLTSDLVIDEIDDFSGSDLIAIGRLVFLAAILGKKVMISSATITPDLAQGYFNIYQRAWKLFAQTREANKKISCTWIDEFQSQFKDIEVDNLSIFEQNHNNFIENRIKKLKLQEVRRKADIINLSEKMKSCQNESDEIKEKSYFGAIKTNIFEKHKFHHIEYGKRKVSFGVVRLANIKPCIKLFNYLLEEKILDKDTSIRIMPYHSRQVLLLRHVQEEHLDEVLKRREKDETIFSNKIIKEHIENTNTQNLIFILIASPIEEIGRDHDFDWAVIEPSSLRSIIQMAGRVRRHRLGSIESSNISLMQYNLKSFKGGQNKKTFQKPGYEYNEHGAYLQSHDLEKIIDINQLSRKVDATFRISKNEELNYKTSLCDLEHYCIQQDLANYDKNRYDANTMQGFLDGYWYLTAHPQIFHAFRNSNQELTLYYYFDDKKEKLCFAQRDEANNYIYREKIYKIKSERSESKRIWLNRNYEELLEIYSEKFNKTKEETSKIFGEINIPKDYEGSELVYNDNFGIKKKD